MVKEKLFKVLFPKMHKMYVARGSALADMDEKFNTLSREKSDLEKLVWRFKQERSFDDVFRDLLVDLGLPTGIDFANVDEDGKPPHYMAGLSDEARANYIARLEAIYSDSHFQDVVKYVINLIGNHSIQKAPDEKMKNGKIGIIGIRTLLTEFKEAHDEYLQSRRDDGDFDPLAAMPE